MRRVVSVVIAIISGFALVWSGVDALGAYATMAIDQYGGTIANRPAVLTPETVQQVLVIYVVISAVALVVMIGAIISAVRARPT